ncbi:MAG: mechanosensitive ion channel family protein [Clostridia bacterium]|nr:mechanosensitive ion channel family protein [Clostridia bacterium]
MDTIKNILNFGKGELTVGNILIAIVVFLICAVVIKVILGIVRKTGEKSKLDNSAVGFIVTVARIGLYFIAIIISCDFIGIPVSSLVAVLSIAGLALSLSVQDLLSNLISGFVILITKPFIGGDFIEIAGKSGLVKTIGFMHTTLLTPDNKTIYIPNHEVSVSNIINYTREDMRRVDLVVSASYDHTAEEVRKSITKSFGKVANIETAPEPFVGVKEYGNSAISYDVRVWCKSEKYWDVYFALNEQIKVGFDADGIGMTYDHINVHMLEK